MSEEPKDADKVNAAFRLGWALAELRGRRRPGFGHELPVAKSRSKRHDHALPLFNERTWTEQTIEAQAVLNTMANEFAGVNPEDTEGKTWTEKVSDLGKCVDKHPGDQHDWDEFTEVIYQWDGHIQDTLVRWPSCAAAYQLGRGLAEIYWALDPKSDPESWTSWEFLLSEERCTTLRALVDRLSKYVDPLRRAAVIGSLKAWQTVAVDERWREADEPKLRQLYEQVVLWRELIRGERDPQDLVGNPFAKRKLGMLVPVLRTFRAQLVVGVMSIILAVLGAYILATSGSSKGGLLLTILGGLGVTSAGLYARAKASAQRLVERLRSVFDEVAVARGAQLLPPRPAPTGAVDRASRGAKELSARLGGVGDLSSLDIR